MTMDDLYIKMIANTKKLKDNESLQQKSLSTQQTTKLFQILESHILSNTNVLSNFDTFTAFFSKYSPQLLYAFEKSLQGKTD